LAVLFLTIKEPKDTFVHLKDRKPVKVPIGRAHETFCKLMIRLKACLVWTWRYTSLQTSMVPKTTWSPSKKLSPTMMTVEPPVVQPSLGQIALIVGVAVHRNPANSRQRPALSYFLNYSPPGSCIIITAWGDLRQV